MRATKTSWVSVLLVGVALLAVVRGEERFFRVTGPTTTVITAFGADGTVVWSNAGWAGVICRVQTATTLYGPSNWVDYAQHDATGVVASLRLFDPNPPSGMVLIPAGVNAGTDPDFGAYALTNGSAFYMDCTAVTKAQWDEVFTWATNHGYGFDNEGNGKAANHPVHTVNWYDCVKWCNARSEKEGWTACYTVSGGTYRTGAVLYPDCNWTAAGYRLPTDVEWQYAARGGVAGHRFPWSDADTITHSRANYYSDAYYGYDVSSTRGYHPTYATGGYPYTSPVGVFAPNGYGLYDMAGNVWEWCWDWYPGYEGSYRVFRGGSWISGFANFARVAYRSFSGPDGESDYVGFRAVLPPGQQ